MRLTHIALEVADLSYMTEFYRDLWGLEVSDQGRDSIFLRSAAPEHHNVALFQGSARRIHHLGFEATGPDDLERVAEAAARAGTPLLNDPGPSNDEPGLGRIVRFGDPDGHVVEVHGRMDALRDDYGTRTVKPRGLNHVVVNVEDLGRSERFYQEVLGFRVSDWITQFMTFLRCNENHHSLAIKQGPPGLDHAAFTTQGWDDISRGVYFLGEQGVHRFWGPGRHGPGNNLFAYFFDPESNLVEYTADVEQVDDASWTPRTWRKEQGNLWPSAGPSLPHE